MKLRKAKQLTQCQTVSKQLSLGLILGGPDPSSVALCAVLAPMGPPAGRSYSQTPMWPRILHLSQGVRLSWGSGQLLGVGGLFAGGLRNKSFEDAKGLAGVQQEILSGDSQTFSWSNSVKWFNSLRRYFPVFWATLKHCQVVSSGNSWKSHLQEGKPADLPSRGR